MSENKISCLVSISDQVFFSMVTASLEAYKVKHIAVTSLKHEPVETYGNIWGYVTKKTSGLSVISAVFADVDTSADRYNGSAIPKKEAFELKRDLVDKFLPELEYIGDFHSHPYSFNSSDRIENVLQLENNFCYNFSKSDDEYFEKLRRSKKRNFRVAFAVTVFEMKKKVIRPDSYMDDCSCIRFMFDKTAVWIKAYAYINKNGPRLASANVAILCPTIGFTSLPLIARSVQEKEN